MGQIVTFYSFKGGTGRSMALANVAWILACNGKKVLVIDWDLEAPGMHRYFRPFLSDPDLISSRGLIDFVIEYALKAVTPQTKSRDNGAKWYVPYTDLVSYAYSLEWSFPGDATIDFVPAGKQDALYPRNVNSFNWENFYETLDGYAFFEEVRNQISESYDYVLIDSRTGVSDTSGICTIQMPDTLVVCFTLNNQSIQGASAIAQTVVDKRSQTPSSRPLRILPVPMRVRHTEVELLARREKQAQLRFDSFVSNNKGYWGGVGVPDVDYYTYEEVLAVFRDTPGKVDTVLASFERLTGLITDSEISALPSGSEYDRQRVLEAFRNGATVARESKHKDFFLSYSHSDHAWAEWIAWELESAGYTVALPSRDFGVGTTFIAELDRSIRGSDRVIALLSPDYIASRWAAHEWQAAFAEQALIPIRVREVETPGILNSLVYIDLVGADEVNARERLLEAVSRGRKLSPAKPPTPAPIGKAQRYPGSLPKIWNVPQRFHDFIGREDILVKLRKALRNGEGVSGIAITGLGGVGKTRLAKEYAYRNAQDYTVVWWLCAENATMLASDFSALARSLHLNSDGESNQPAAIQEVLRWLRQNKSWLLIFDNAPDADTIRPYLPTPTAGHVIITSRNPLWRANSRVLLLDVLVRDASVTYLQERSGQTDPVSARALAEQLGDLPLALEQAAAYIEQTEISIADYLKLTRDFAKDLLEPVTAGFQLSMEKVRSELPAAIELLSVIAFLQSSSIPRKLLEPTAPNPLEFNKRVTSLRRYSLIESKESSINTHRLIQQATRDGLTSGEREHFVEMAVELVGKAFPHEVFNPTSWLDGKTLLPHALVCTSFAEHLGVALEPASDLLSLAGLYLSEQARYDEAETVLQRALSTAERLRGPDHPTVASLLSHLGQVSMMKGDFERALTLTERSLDIATRTYGPDHPTMAMVYNNLGQILMRKGDLVRANTFINRARGIDEQVYGPKGPNAAVSLSNLSQIAAAFGNLEAALRLMQRALAIDQTVYGPDHPRVASRLNNLGEILANQANYKEALPVLSRALANYEAAYGPDHPNVALVLGNLGQTLLHTGDLRGALDAARRALAIDEKVLGSNHPDIARDLYNISGVLLAQDDVEQASQHSQRAVSILESSLGSKHPLTRAAITQRDDVLKRLRDRPTNT